MTSPALQKSLVLPRQPGTYALIFSLYDSSQICIGKLGDFFFPAGYYLYIGSALGSGGLAGRLYRHIYRSETDGPRHWHVDYLAAKASLQEIWYYSYPNRREHVWAETASGLDGALIPVPRFGASDCHCPAHLYFFESRPDRENFNLLLSMRKPREPVVIGQSLANIQS